MKKNFTIQNTVITTVSSMNTAHKTMSSIKFVRTNVLTLFILFCFWQTGMGQSVFLPGNPPIIGDAPVGINIPPAPGIDFHVNGNIRFQGLPNITLANSFLARDVVGNIFHQTGSLPLLGTALGQSLYWSGTNWQYTNLLYIDPISNRVGVGTTTPLTIVGSNSGPVGAAMWMGIGSTSTSQLLAVNGEIGVLNDIYTGGNIYILSDERIKNNFKTLENWRKILEIPAYSYLFNNDQTHVSRYGFKAQEVYKTLPELTANWNGALAVNYISFIPFMLKGMQEYDNRLDTLEQNQGSNFEANRKLEKLEYENEQLRNRLILLENFVYNQQIEETGTLQELPSLEQNEPNPFTQEPLFATSCPKGLKMPKLK